MRLKNRKQSQLWNCHRLAVNTYEPQVEVSQVKCFFCSLGAPEDSRTQV